MAQTHTHMTAKAKAPPHARTRGDDAPHSKAEKADPWASLIGLPVGIAGTGVSPEGVLSGTLTEEGARAVFEKMQGKGAH